VELVPPESNCATELAIRLYETSITLPRLKGGPRLVLVGLHQAFVHAQKRLARLAPTDNPVLISGETGTGKELIARAIYALSPRQSMPFVSINCAQLQDSTLAVSQLFGHRRGSFTGAQTDRQGLFEAAERGTLFLDEIGELPPSTQALMLRAVGEGEVLRLGDTCARHIDVRLIGHPLLVSSG
jgi:Nif-specific regulatory protein